ncbi:MAG: tyrosine-protein phosphatase [Candidatus Babeliales bacterium]|jgi:undecaprenyl-diphosphatase
MNNVAKKIAAFIVTVVSVMHFSFHDLSAQGWWKKVASCIVRNPFNKNFLLHNPLKPLTKIVQGPNVFVPIDPIDFKEGIYQDNFYAVQTGALYRSRMLPADTLAAYVKQYGIKTIINLCGKDPGQTWWRNEKAVADRHNVVLLDIPTSADTLTSKENIKSILDAFDHAPRPLLVHCFLGIDRTGEVAALWKLDQQGAGKTEALKELSVWHRHNKKQYPAKSFLIKIWRGREWFYNEYDPQNYPQFCSKNGTKRD